MRHQPRDCLAAARHLGGPRAGGARSDLSGSTPAQSNPNTGTADANEAPTVRYLYQNVEVLAIGQTAAADVGATEAPANPGSGLITFNVPPDAAQRIALAGNNLYMTLAPKDFQPVDVPPVDFSNLFQPGVLSPYPAGG